MEEKVTVPYILFEGELARAERRQKRNFILIIVLIAALLLSNFGWLYAWMQYDYVGNDITVDAGERGIASYVGDDGDITYGKDSSETKNKDAK